MPGVDAGFVAQLDEEARDAFLWACPRFTGIFVLWSGFDYLLAPSWWLPFLGLRVGFGFVACGLYLASLQRRTARHRWVLLAWVLGFATSIACMLPLVDEAHFPYFTMGYSLCVLGISSFATMRPADVAVGLAAFLVLFLPSAFVVGFGSVPALGSAFFLITLCSAALFQASQRHGAALASWQDRVALALARDEALAADREKSAFLARMSHELRTPLNAIIGYSELLSDELPEAVDDLSRIEGAGRHLLELINDVLDLSKVAAGELQVRDQEVDLHACLSELRPLAERLVDERGNVLRWDVEPLVARGVPSECGRLCSTWSPTRRNSPRRAW